MTKQTDPLVSGVSTSEGRLTIALCLVGGLLEAVAISLKCTIETYSPVLWLALTSLVTGAALQVLTAVAYVKSRSALKANALLQAIASGVPSVTAALGAAALQNVKGTPARAMAQLLGVQLRVGQALTQPPPVQTPPTGG